MRSPDGKAENLDTLTMLMGLENYKWGPGAARNPPLTNRAFVWARPREDAVSPELSNNSPASLRLFQRHQRGRASGDHLVSKENVLITKELQNQRSRTYSKLRETVWQIEYVKIKLQGCE